jgi:hypothetical protein
LSEPFEVVGSDGGSGAPASTTYQLSDLSVDHPANGRDDRAIVGYTATWATGHYPGEGQCTIVLSDENGVEVGRTEFGLGTEQQVSPQMETQPFPVQGVPADAAGWCLGDPDDPANFGQGYEFADPRVSASEQIDGIEIAFTVSWIGDSSPGMRTCILDLTLADGDHHRSRSGIHIGEPSARVTRLVEGLEPADVVSIDVTCHPPSAQ